MAEIKTQNSIVDKIYATYKDEGHRAHLGASMIGHECDRALWYSFRWCYESNFSGRILRLFERGQREEEILIRNLRDAGYEVYDVDPETGEQFRFAECNGHFGGSMDGCILGVDDAPKTWHVLEFKTSSDKYFKQLEKEGVQQAQPTHYAQMQVYMGLSGMKRALYISVNKNTDEIYTERVRYDAKEYKRLIKKAQYIIDMPEPPERMPGAGEAFYKCKWCNAYDVCWGNKMPLVNCRTCAFSTPVENGKWSCDKHDCLQIDCSDHRYIPPLIVGCECVDYADDAFIYERDGVRFANGNYEFLTDADMTINYTSKELEALRPVEICNKLIDDCKRMLDGVVDDSENLKK